LIWSRVERDSHGTARNREHPLSIAHQLPGRNILKNWEWNPLIWGQYPGTPASVNLRQASNFRHGFLQFCNQQDKIFFASLRRATVPGFTKQIRQKRSCGSKKTKSTTQQRRESTIRKQWSLRSGGGWISCHWAPI
jgi:hypothetical protein